MYDAPYRWFDHTADIGMEVRGDTVPELFLHAAQGLYDLLGASPDALEEVEEELEDEIALRGADLEELFVGWLSELLYRFTGEGEVFTELEVEIEGDTLHARVRGGALSRRDRRGTREIKGVTYHGLDVRDTGHGWEAQVVFDV